MPPPLKFVGTAESDAEEPDAVLLAAEPEGVLEALTVVPKPPEVEDAAGTVRVLELSGRKFQKKRRGTG